MKIFSALAPVAIAAALALTACTPTPQAPAPSSSPTTITTPAPAPVAAPCEEDEPCWDCKTMGNLTCNITTDATATDAWATFDAFDFAPGEPTTVEYSRTLDNNSFVLPQDEFALESISTPNVWHIFHTSPTTQPAPVAAPQPVTALVQAPQPVKVQTPAPVVVSPVAPHTAPAPVRCEEDQPCWVCSEMGNKICGPIADIAVGPTTPPAPVVTPAPAPVFCDQVQLGHGEDARTCTWRMLAAVTIHPASCEVDYLGAPHKGATVPACSLASVHYVDGPPTTSTDAKCYIDLGTFGNLPCMATTRG